MPTRGPTHGPSRGESPDVSRPDPAKAARQPIADMELLGHDVRLDGVAFWRARAAVPSRMCLDPGAVVYFVAVVSGQLTLRTQFPEEDTIALRAGDCVSLSGMTSHVFDAGAASGGGPIGRFALLDFAAGRDPGAPVDLIVGVAPHEAMALANMINGPLQILQRHDVEYARHIWKALEFLEDEFTGQAMHFDREQVVRRMAEIVSIDINRAISNRGSPRMRNFTARRSAAYHRGIRGVWRSLSLFLERPFDDWGVGRLARDAGMSRTVYCESFKLATGMTPKRSISRIRLALVARKLAIDRLSVYDAAELAGYGSAAAFIRAFSREFGDTPARWRTQRRR